MDAIGEAGDQCHPWMVGGSVIHLGSHGAERGGGGDWFVKLSVHMEGLVAAYGPRNNDGHNLEAYVVNLKFSGGGLVQ